jgi:hypothetical protein
MIAIIRTRPPFARVEYEPYHFLRWTEIFPEKDFLWLAKNPSKISNRFGLDNFPRIDSYDMQEYYDAETVVEKKRILDKIVEENGITQLITIHNDIRSQFKNGSEDKGVSFFETDKIPTFASVKGFYEPTFIPYHMSKTIPVIHIYVDPQEGSWNKINGANETNFFFYQNPRIGAEYFPFVEWSFAKEIGSKFQKRKKFAFGFTVVTEDRESLYHQLAALKEHDINFLVKFPKLDIDTTVKRSDYSDMLKESEFTLVIPSYEDTDFSSIRFWDALVKGCIPFVLDSCRWEQAFVEHPDLTKIIKEDLLVTVDTVKSKIEGTNYRELLNKIHNTNDWKKLKSTEWFVRKSRNFEDCLHQTNDRPVAPRPKERKIALF